jgi:hypothetical protein
VDTDVVDIGAVIVVVTVESRKKKLNKKLVKL